jgi:serine/threonine protein kinase
MKQSTPPANQCARCGQALPTHAPEGLCPRCLISLNLSTEGDTALPGEGGPALPPLPLEKVAALFPALEVREALGRGGMGSVYKVRQPRLDRMAALKILSPERQGDRQFAARFEREARTLARLNHPNIVTIYESGETQGHCFLLMEYVDGLTLRRLIQAGGLAPVKALEIVARICEALQYAHQRGVIHRDIKPENILLDTTGAVKIADFGIAKLGEAGGPGAVTEEKQVIGTPHYMAPEQWEKPSAVDHRADIYSLGVVFYELLTGELPLGKFAPPSNVSGVKVDARLDDVVLRALEKKPERRYQQAGEVQKDVETIAGGPAGFEPKSMNSLQRTKWGFALIGIILVILALGKVAVVQLWPRLEAEKSSQLNQEGWAAWNGRQMDQARQKFSEALKYDPKNVSAWNGLGWACFNLGEEKPAENAFRKVLELEPDHPAACNGLGQIFLAQRKNDEAEAYLLRAAPRAPAAWYGLARLYLGEGKYDEAAIWAKKVVDTGQAGATGQRMLQAAQEKHVSASLREELGIPAAP